MASRTLLDTQPAIWVARPISVQKIEPNNIITKDLERVGRDISLDMIDTSRQSPY